MEETSKDSISNRLSRRMTFEPDLMKNNNSMMNSFNQPHYNYTTTNKPDFYQEKPQTYLPNACSSALPVVKKNTMPPLGDIDLRKPVNYQKSSNLTANVKDNFYTRTNGNSDIINERMQDFSLLGTAQAYPMQKKSTLLHLPNNKPIDTRNSQTGYRKYG